MSHADSPEVMAAERRSVDTPRRITATPALATGFALAAGVGLLAVRDPHVAGSFGVCPLLALTGMACPLCGGLRATNVLIHADLAGAWAMNPLWVVLIPVVVTLWVLWLVRSSRGQRMPRVLGTSATMWTVAAVAVGYTIVRNLPQMTDLMGPGAWN